MNSIKQEILIYLEEQGSWTFGGSIEDYIRINTKHKASNVSRRCRELVNEGKIERQLTKVEGVGPSVVQYKIIREVAVDKPICYVQSSLL